ncbi:MAG: SPOR domain-containing protein [Pseudomonadota bacterium]
MDRVLLKRLLGAGVVVALAVIVLPFVLQGDGYQASLRTDIPARPAPLQPLDTAVPEPSEDVRQQLQPPQPLPAPARPREIQLPEPKPTPAPMPKSEPQPASAPAPKAEPKTEAKPAPKVETRSQPKPEERPPEVRPVEPRVAAPPVAKPPAVGQWLVQLGSFSSESNAQTLRGQVQRAGLPCLMERLDIEGRTVWRVRAGPFASQSEADAALKKLQGGLKLGGMVMQVR